MSMSDMVAERKRKFNVRSLLETTIILDWLFRFALHALCSLSRRATYDTCTLFVQSKLRTIMCALLKLCLCQYRSETLYFLCLGQPALTFSSLQNPLPNGRHQRRSTRMRKNTSFLPASRLRHDDQRSNISVLRVIYSSIAAKYCGLV